MSKVTKAAIGLMMATMVAKILGFTRELVLASAYGTSMYSDAYLVAMNIPIVIFTAIGSAIANTFIPIYFDIEKNHGIKRTNYFMNNVFNIISVICIIFSILGFIWAEQIVKIFAMGFEGEVLSITIKFTRVIVFGVIFIGLSNLITSFLQAKNRFGVIGLVSLPYNIIIIISIIASIKFGPYTMIYGSLIGIIGQVLFQIPFAVKEGYRYKVVCDFKDEYLKKMLQLVIPVFIGVAVNQVNTIVDKTLASTLVEGSISALNYANKLNGFVMGIFIISISSVVYPMFSELSSKNDREELTKVITNSANTVILLVIPITVGAIVLSVPIVKILFQRGAFDANATKMTAGALAFYSIGLIGMGLRDILGKVFYSIQDTKTPMINGVFSMIINILLNIILIKYMNHIGLAFATSISSIVCVIMLFISLDKKIGDFGQKNIIKTLLKAIIASIIMGIMTVFVYTILSNILYGRSIYDIINLLISILVGSIIYAVLVLVLKVDEVLYIVKKIKIRGEN